MDWVVLEPMDGVGMVVIVLAIPFKVMRDGIKVSTDAMVLVICPISPYLQIIQVNTPALI